MELDSHKHKKHGPREKPCEWNCNDCAFQANSPNELMNHLKLTAHQPSQDIKEKRKLFREYKQCYTCKLEFDGYWNLMEHRKSVHPSIKRCRNFPGGKCGFGNECWYVHEEQLMDIDESFNDESKRMITKYKCNICDADFESKDWFMKHKKTSHEGHVPACEKFAKDICSRSDDHCWYIHLLGKETPSSKDKKSPENQNSQLNQQQVFQEASVNPFPPDHLMQKMMEAMNMLCTKVEIMEKRMQELMK